MPDYGLRPPPYFSGNLPVGILGVSPYGWAQQPHGTTANTPFNSYFPSEQFVYERMDWQKFKQQLASAGLYNSEGMNKVQNTAGYYSNPPFMGAGQMTGPDGAPSWMRDQIGGTKRILRGYLRRQRVDASNPSSFVRLYFMYNPDQVQRTYQSLSDSQTLDPTTEQGVETDASIASEPFVATISFTLYFDRQIEVATIEDHPGVMVDLQAFDVLAGQLIFGSSDGTGSTSTVLPAGMSIPDNTDTSADHSGMLQPRSTAMPITAVFSPSLAVEGMLAGVSATFTKFSMNMTPMTLGLNLTLLVSYVGKNNNQTTTADVGAGVTNNPQVYNPSAPGYVSPTTQKDRDYQTLSGAYEAVNYGNTVLLDTGTDGHYDNSTVLNGKPRREIGPPCSTEHPFWTDCSSFVWRCFHAIGWVGIDQGDLLGLGGDCKGGIPSSGMMATDIRRLSTGPNRRWYIWQDLYNDDPPDSETSWDTAASQFNALRRGDVLIRLPGYRSDTGHVAFFVDHVGDLSGSRWRDKSALQILDSGGKNMGSYKQGGQMRTMSMADMWDGYNIWARPEPFGPTTVPLGFGAVTT